MAATISKRLAIYFWSLLIITTIGVYGILRTFWNSAWLEREQLFFWGVAEQYRAVLGPMLEEGASSDDILRTLYELSQLNPRVEIYILSQSGEPQYYLPQPFQKMVPTVDLEPIKRFLSYEESRDLPILGTIPRLCYERTDCPTDIFSAAETTVNGKPGFIYVLLNNSAYHSLSAGIEDVYLMFGGGMLIVLFTTAMGMLGMLLFSRITSRLRRVALATRQYRDGNLASRVHDESGDEISQLAEDFNTMADTISEQMTFLKSNDELRRELVANVSHDFKSPITSLQGNLQLLELQYDSLDDEQRRKRIQNAAKCTEVLDRRIKEFCELSELEAKKVVPEISVFSITELITEELIPRFQARADERALVLRADCPDTLPSVRGDCHLVERVLTNLLENAINYANEGTEVLVRVQQENELEKLRISVEDTGKGIPEEELGKIFNRHYRGLRSRDLTGGSGLGLAIVKEIVEAHGESITVTSAQGRTRFSFNLPISGLQRFE